MTFLDTATNYRLTVRNGVLVFASGDATSPGLEVTGDTDALPSLLAALDRPDPNFDIVTT